MNKPRRAAVLTAAVLSLFLTVCARAQPPGFGGAGIPNLDPQQMQNMMQQFQNMDPSQLQSMMQQFQNMDPRQMQGAMQQLITMDPQQMQKSLEERENAAIREEMGVASDADWAPIQERIKAVTKAQAAISADNVGAMIGRIGLGVGRGSGVQGLAGRLTPEAQALQAAIDANAPSGQMQNLMARLRDARETKRLALTKAQDELRARLTPLQEVVAVLRGLLD